MGRITTDSPEWNAQTQFSFGYRLSIQGGTSGYYTVTTYKNHILFCLNQEKSGREIL